MIISIHQHLIMHFENLHMNVKDLRLHSIAALLELMLFDRYKGLIAVLLAWVYAFSICDDIQSGYKTFVLSRCNISEYVCSKIVTNTVGVLVAVEGGFCLYYLILSPISEMGGNGNYFSYFQMIADSQFSWMYMILVGLILGLSIAFLTNLSMLIGIFVPNRYVICASPYVLFYFFFYLSPLLPKKMNFWYLSVGYSVLGHDEFWSNYLYAISFFLVGSVLICIAMVAVMRRRLADAKV